MHFGLRGFSVYGEGYWRAMQGLHIRVGRKSEFWKFETGIEIGSPYKKFKTKTGTSAHPCCIWWELHRKKIIKDVWIWEKSAVNSMLHFCVSFCSFLAKNRDFRSVSSRFSRWVTREYIYSFSWAFRFQMNNNGHLDQLSLGPSGVNLLCVLNWSK